MSRLKQAVIATASRLGCFPLGLAVQHMALGRHFVRVLNYHDTPQRWADGLERQLGFYREHFDPATPDDLEACLDGRWTGRRPRLLITFDDGYRSNHDVAAPLLEKHGFRGYFFLPESAIAADRDSFDAHFLLAKVYTRKSDPEAAMRQYQEAIRVNPRSADAQFNLGFVYFSQKRYEEARNQYEKVVELNPPYLADVFYNLSACYEQMKKKSEAVATLRRGLETVPSSDLLRQRLRQLGG